MNASQKRAFYYHADASALGGVLDHPVQQIISTSGSVSLPQSGGSTTLRLEGFRADGMLSLTSGVVSASGSGDEETGWRTLVTATVEDLNIFEVVTADRIVAQMSVMHPPDDGPAWISLNGTKFENLKINGQLIEPVLDRRLFLGKPGDDGKPVVGRSGLPFEEVLWVSLQQYEELKASGIGSLGKRFAFNSPEVDLLRKGSALCSVVREVGVEAPSRAFCHIINVPDFGNVFLGEMLVNRFSAQLTMVRAEMGSMAGGGVSSGTVSSNGSTMP